jgi:hypothetical protein
VVRQLSNLLRHHHEQRPRQILRPALAHVVHRRELAATSLAGRPHLRAPFTQYKLTQYHAWHVPHNIQHDTSDSPRRRCRTLACPRGLSPHACIGPSPPRTSQRW